MDGESGDTQQNHGSLSLMIEEHSELRAAMTEMRLALQSDIDVAIHQLRWRLSFLIARHVSVEDSHIYPVLANDPRPNVAAIVARFTGQIGELKARATAWRADWNGESIQADRAGFAAATTALFKEIDHRMMIEERDLFPLIDEAERRSR